MIGNWMELYIGCINLGLAKALRVAFGQKLEITFAYYMRDVLEK